MYVDLKCFINSCEDWQSLDESWDSHLPTPLALDFCSLRDDEDDMMSNTQRSYSNGNAEDFYPNGDGYQGQYIQKLFTNGYIVSVEFKGQNSSCKAWLNCGW